MITLTSFPTLVQAPFIIVKIGEYTFGKASKEERGNRIKVTFPDYMESLTVKKINGDVNKYTIKINYHISFGDDPNMMEKVFSSVSSTREITISYGDWRCPSFIYKEEQALITGVTSSFQYNTSTIGYTVTCISSVLNSNAEYFSFPTRTAKPSSIIMNELLTNYGLDKVFTGMKNKEAIKKYGLIATDDAEVMIEGCTNTSPYEYLCHLVKYMVPSDGDGVYKLAVDDDTRNDFGGPYFKISKVSKGLVINNEDSYLNSNLDIGAYEITIGYPGDNFVTDFSLSNDTQWSILYKSALETKQRTHTYKFDTYGNMHIEEAPSLCVSNVSHGITAEDRNWWHEVTEYPIKATLTLKGLVSPTLLLTYVKINVMIRGSKHVSSGYYVILEQNDTVDKSGYKTTLNLLRIVADDDYQDYYTGEVRRG